jgi:RNA ligase (TIGR02306 family)
MTSVDADRKLATIVTVAGFESIPKADNIELVLFKENIWKVVAKKGEFKVGDLAIYFSIGSILDPANENTKFLEGKPLKTKKILGVISQGLAAPIKWIEDYGVTISSLKVDDDVTNVMRVKKFVPLTEQDLYEKKSLATFPKDIVPQTEEERVQNCLGRLSEMITNDLNIVVTKKFDGTSFTIVYAILKTQTAPGGPSDAKELFMACGRNKVIEEPSETIKQDHYYEMVYKYDLKNKMKAICRNIAIQGEICGPKINCNRMKRKDNDFFVFNIWDIDNQYYLPWADVVEITKKLGLQTVDVLYIGKFSEFKELKITEDKNSENYVKAVATAILEYSSNQEYGKGIPAEGIVIKSDYGKEYPRISCKAISNKYLLKHNE